MMRLGEIGALLVSVAVATAALSSGAEARDIRITRKPAATAPAPVAASTVRDVTPKAGPAAVRASLPTAEAPACARKVKVIYAGYGEAERVNCTLASAESVSATGLRTETR